MSASPAFFISDGERFVATESTRGPWSREYQHGGPPAALLARAMERLAGDDTLLARMTFDFLRPVPIAPLTVRVEVTRAGTKVRAYHTSVETRIARGTWGKGPVMAWMRLRVALVEGETPSPVPRLLVVADSASGLAVVLEPARYTFVNANLTVSVHRAPEGEWVGIDAATMAEAHGVGLTRARLWDARGAIGVSLQTCLVESRAPSRVG